MILYQFPISHYCEKARFALDYKGIAYQQKNLLPGLHSMTATRLGSGSSVSILSDQGKGIQGSAAIVSYLDDVYPQRLLTPADPSSREAALNWESWLDAEAGVAVRLVCYHYLLPRQDLITSYFLQGGPWWGRIYLYFGYDKLVARMRHFMKINDASAAAALERIDEYLDRLNAFYAQDDYLVGGNFSRADLTAAALFAPILQPKGYGIAWGDGELPPELALIREQMLPRLEWAGRIYREHRGA